MTVVIAAGKSTAWDDPRVPDDRGPVQPGVLTSARSDHLGTKVRWICVDALFGIDSFLPDIGIRLDNYSSIQEASIRVVPAKGFRLLLLLLSVCKAMS